jgi:uncharacterized protein YggL (DUF469 family)
MELKGKITIRFSREQTTIEIKDDEANVTFVKVTLTPEQLSAALSQQMHVDCSVEVHEIEKVGKKHENTTLEFEIPSELANSIHSEELQKIAQSMLSDGWIAENYFRSQNSFFKNNNKQYARCTIRRWV